MRIGLDCRRILHPEKGETAGIGQYVHHLAAALVNEAAGHELVLFFDHHDAARDKQELVRGHANVTARVLPFHLFRRIPLVRSHAIVSALFARERLDVLHGPANATPMFYRGRSVVTIHDLAAYDHPEWFPSPFPGADSFSRRVVVPGSVAAARRVIAVSEATKRDIVRLFGTDPAKIDVVHEAAAIAFAPAADAAHVLAKHGIKEGKYVLSLSTIEPRKNIASLVWAFARAAKDGSIPKDMQLIVAGGKGWKSEETFEAIDAAAVTLGKHRVRWIGRVEESEKPALIAGAAAFVYPSLYEGFGLPVLEAMSLGTPVIASSASSLPEVCGARLPDGQDAAILVDPADIDGLAEAIGRIFADPVGAAALVEKSRERAATFSWQRAARETLEVYRKAAVR